MGDLDISLIKEFAIRPAFYNKTSPHYKDKIFTERAWLDISHKLGYNVSLLKDRMYQLRNRYNLEKRKVEGLRADGVRNAKSSWALFQHLNFLSSHIRPRKSYKSMMKRSLTGHANSDDNTNDNDVDDGVDGSEIGSPPLPHVEIKCEEDCEDEHHAVNGQNYQQQNGYEYEADGASDQKNGSTFVDPATLLLIDDSESDNDLDETKSKNKTSMKSPQNRISLRNVNDMKRHRDVSTIIDLSQSEQHQHHQQEQQQQQGQQEHHLPPYKSRRIHQSSDKFSAFGSFVTSSLLDLPEKCALELVEKFTNELVKSLMANVENQ